MKFADAFFVNSKPTISAVISAAASFVLFAHELHFAIFPQWILALSLFAQIGGLAALGITAKQYNVTGGTIVQDGSAVATVTPVAGPPVQVVTLPTSPVTDPPVPVK